MNGRAVLLTAFNREAQLKRQLEILMNSNVDRIYLFCDGPRGRDEEEDFEVERVHKIAGTLSRDNRIFLLLQSENLGCRRAIETAITWFFSHEESGAILEDDVQIEAQGIEALFELLHQFRNSSKVGSVTVCSYVPRSVLENSESEIRTSNYIQSIAWGTWKSRWTYYVDQNGKDLESWSLYRLIQSRGLSSGLFWWKTMNRVRKKSLDTWDVPWLAHCWNYGLKTVVTNANYALHTGWGVRATHTKNETIPYWARGTISPKSLKISNIDAKFDPQAENWMSSNFYNESVPSWLRSYLARFSQKFRIYKLVVNNIRRLDSR